MIAYQFGTRTLIGFILLIGFAIHALGTFALLIGLSLARLLGWDLATRLTTGVPIKRFYTEHGELVDRAYRKAGLILMSASFVGGIASGVAAGFLMASGRL